jgi:hypothetical protein
MRRHAHLFGLAAIHQLAFWWVVGSGNPQATVTFDCVSGAMGRDVLRGFAYGPFDAYDGILGGMAVSATVGAPLLGALGFSGLGVKAVAGFWSLATVLIGAVFLDRAFDRRTSLIGGLLLALPMPTMFLASTILGNWHYTEMLFELAVAGGLCWLVWGRGLKRRAGLFGFGVLSGLALFNCFGSLIFFGAFWAVMWAMLRVRAGWGGIVRYVIGLGIGAAPLWAKILLHRPYGVPVAADGGTGVPKEMLALQLDPAKLLDLVVDNGFSWGLHFQDVLDVPKGTVLSMTLATGVALALFVGWLLLLWRTRPSIAALLSGLRPGRPASLESVSPAVVPALMGVFYAAAWFLSDMSVEVRPWYLANVRDLGHATLIPWSMAMGLCLAVLIGSLVRERRGGRHPGEAPLPTGPVLALLALGLFWTLGANAFGIARAGGPPSTPIVRGLCHDVHGFYMGPHVVGEGVLTAEGDRLEEAQTVARAEEACAPYGPENVRECVRGVAWSLGFGQVEFEEREFEEGPGRGNRCLLLPTELRSECLRGMGWALQSMGEGGVEIVGGETSRCGDFESSVDRAACWRGVGFPLGDHLSNKPARLMRALKDFPPAVRPDIARGAATHLGRTYSSWSWMVGMCQTWDAEYKTACVAGLEDSMAWRPDAAGVRAR